MFIYSNLCWRFWIVWRHKTKKDTFEESFYQHKLASKSDQSVSFWFSKVQIFLCPLVVRNSDTGRQILFRPFGSWVKLTKARIVVITHVLWIKQKATELKIMLEIKISDIEINDWYCFNRSLVLPQNLKLWIIYLSGQAHSWFKLCQRNKKKE